MTALAAAWMAWGLALAWRWRPHPARLARLTAPPRPREPRTDRQRRRLTVAGVVAGGLALGALWPPLAALPFVALAGRRRWIRARQQRRARHAVTTALPDTVDLLVVAIGAGLTPALAIQHLAVLAPPPFAAAFAETRRRVEHGQRVADALEALTEQLGDPVRPLVAAVTGAERYGAPLAPTLDVLAHEARRERRRQAEEAARTLPVKLCFPLVGCILPAFVLLTIAPLIAGALRSLAV